MIMGELKARLKRCEWIDFRINEQQIKSVHCLTLTCKKG